MRRFLAAFALRGRDELHKEGLRREATPAAMARFDIARFSIAGKDVFRLDAYLRLFHFASSFEYVGSGAWRREPEFQRFPRHKAERMRQAGEKLVCGVISA